jgi:hypothetical protein
MGGHGGLNILPQKSWNVYSARNRARVAADEAQAELDAANAAVAAVAEQARANLLTLRARAGGGADNGGENVLHPPTGEHVNLFAEIEAAERQAEREAARKREDARLVARLMPDLDLSKSAREPAPWYTRAPEPEHGGSTSSTAAATTTMAASASAALALGSTSNVSDHRDEQQRRKRRALGDEKEEQYVEEEESRERKPGRRHRGHRHREHKGHVRERHHPRSHRRSHRHGKRNDDDDEEEEEEEDEEEYSDDRGGRRSSSGKRRRHSQRAGEPKIQARLDGELLAQLRQERLARERHEQQRAAGVVVPTPHGGRGGVHGHGQGHGRLAVLGVGRGTPDLMAAAGGSDESQLHDRFMALTGQVVSLKPRAPRSSGLAGRPLQ